jgi:hypothetical protein
MNRKLSYKHWETGTEVHKLIKPLIKSINDDQIATQEKVFDEITSLTECTNVSKTIV